MVVESGALYLAVQLVFVILIALDHPAQNIISVMAVQIYVRRGHVRSKRDANTLADHPVRDQGIAPTLIIIRVGLGASARSTTVIDATRRASWPYGATSVYSRSQGTER